MKIKNLIWVFALLFFIACNDDDGSAAPSTNTEPKDYTGQWNGEFEGGDEGFLRMTISSDNSLQGLGYSTNIAQNFNFSGSINDDGSLPGAESNLKTTFVGQFSDSTASGTWSNASGSITGTWFLER